MIVADSVRSDRSHLISLMTIRFIVAIAAQFTPRWNFIDVLQSIRQYPNLPISQSLIFSDCTISLSLNFPTSQSLFHNFFFFHPSTPPYNLNYQVSFLFIVLLFMFIFSFFSPHHHHPFTSVFLMHQQSSSTNTLLLTCTSAFVSSINTYT